MIIPNPRLPGHYAALSSVLVETNFMKNLLQDKPSKQVMRLHRAGEIHTGYTVKQIRDCLEQLDDNMLVVGTWESIYVPVQAMYVLLDCNDEYQEPVVVMDVDQH